MSGFGFGSAKVYLASRYSRLPELLNYKDDLEKRGYVVVGRWLQGNHQIDDAGLSMEAAAEERTRFATEDYEDLMSADSVIVFTEEPRTTNTRGGKHVEFGIALASGKEVIAVGPRENVFYCLPKVRVLPDWPTLITALDAVHPRTATAIQIGDELAAKLAE